MKSKGKTLLARCMVISALALVAAGMTGCSGCSDEGKDGTVRPGNREARQEGTLTVTVYAYCPCAKCNSEQWKGMVATGHKMKALQARGKNICAADTSVIPMESIVTYKGKDYVVADRGGKTKGNVISILVPTHRDVKAFGVKRNQTITYRQ
jgi:3D (Asp-Asp-Asp) domain-containing protein